jgi:ribosomal protein L9
MKLIDYLAKRQRHKELRQQLKDVKYDIGLNCQVYSEASNKKMKESCIRESIKLKKQQLSLEEELREVFKDQIGGPDLNSGRGGPDD